VIDEVVRRLRARGDSLSSEAAALIESLQPKSSIPVTPHSRAQSWLFDERYRIAKRKGWRAGEPLAPYMDARTRWRLQRRAGKLELWLTLFPYRCTRESQPCA